MHFALVYLIELLATSSGQDGKIVFPYIHSYVYHSIYVFGLFMKLKVS